MAITAWYMDDVESTDQRLPHSPIPSVSVSIQQLAALGVLSWSDLEGAGPSAALSRSQQIFLLIVLFCDHHRPLSLSFR